MKKLFVISLGGSLIVPDQIDTGYLKKFKQLIVSQTKRGNRFIISPGGGRTCRNYQAALKQIGKASAQDLDLIGLQTNKFHAQLLRLIFKSLSEPEIAQDPNRRVPFRKPVLIGAGGWKPGRSSDDFAVRLAKVYQAKTVINLSNIDYVYTKDPKKFQQAKKIKQISWQNFRNLIGDKWDPGKNVPFDPTAAKFAEKNNITVVITNGHNLPNLKNIFMGWSIEGTIIS